MTTKKSSTFEEKREYTPAGKILVMPMIKHNPSTAVSSLVLFGVELRPPGHFMKSKNPGSQHGPSTTVTSYLLKTPINTQYLLYCALVAWQRFSLYHACFMLYF